MTETKSLSLELLPPNLRAELETGNPLTGVPHWALIAGGRVDLDTTLFRLQLRIEELKERAERMNERFRTEMRYGDYNDPGFPERQILLAAEHLEEVARDLAAVALPSP